MSILGAFHVKNLLVRDTAYGQSSQRELTCYEPVKGFAEIRAFSPASAWFLLYDKVYIEVPPNRYGLRVVRSIIILCEYLCGYAFTFS